MHSTSSYDAQSKRYDIFKMPTQCRVCETQRKRGTKFWQVLDVVLGFPVQAFIFNMRIPRPRMGGPQACLYFLRAVMYRPTYGPPIRGFIFGSPNLCIFLKKTQRYVLFFYIRIGTPGPTYVSLLTILYIFKLFYMLTVQFTYSLLFGLQGLSQNFSFSIL